MDRAVLLAWRTSHDGNTRIKKIIPSHFQTGGAPTEHFGEQLAETSVHGVESIFKPAPRFLVDLLDGVLKRFQRSTQIIILGVKILLPLFRPACLVYRR